MNKQFSRRDFLKLVPLAASTLGSFGPARVLSGTETGGRQYPLGPNKLDVLSDSQKAALIEASLHFLAPNEAEANRVALEIDFIEGLNEHSSTMCGPLSISILRRAGLLGSWVEPRDFWLLNPRDDLLTASNVFPIHQYDWFHFEQAISEFDFSSFPLVAGDLLYLHGSASDTFEHILVVNRVDSRGRAFTVSNFFTQTETLIEERMLYDPGRNGLGQFDRWANRDIRNTIGNTGSGGFRIWRTKDGGSLEFSNDEARQAMQAALDQIFLAGPGSWYAEIRGSNGKSLYQFNPYEAFHPASTIKVAIGLAFMDRLNKEGQPDPLTFLLDKGTDGRTYDQLLRAMLIESEEEATESLVDFLGAGRIEEALRLWDYSRSKIDPRRSSAWEVTRLFDELADGTNIDPFSKKYLLGMLSTYTPNDETRSGLFKELLPRGSVIYNKRASLVESPRVVGDSGIIAIGDALGASHANISFSVHGLGKDGASYEALEASLDAAMIALGKYLSSTYSK